MLRASYSFDRTNATHSTEPEPRVRGAAGGPGRGVRPGQAQAAAIQAIEDYIFTNGYSIPLYDETQVFGLAPNVHGFATESTGARLVLRHLALQLTDRADMSLMRNYVSNGWARRSWCCGPPTPCRSCCSVALPGDAISNRIQAPDSDISPEGAQILLAFYGLDRPLWEQYLHGLGAAVQGDLGYSLNTGQPVTELIGDALPSTLRADPAGAAVRDRARRGHRASSINYAPWAWLRSFVGSAPRAVRVGADVRRRHPAAAVLRLPASG